MDTAIDPSMKYEESLKSLSISASSQISAMEARYACRGIVKAVQTDADYQEKKENETSALEPLAYRLSALCDRGLDARYFLPISMIRARYARARRILPKPLRVTRRYMPKRRKNLVCR